MLGDDSAGRGNKMKSHAKLGALPVWAQEKRIDFLGRTSIAVANIIHLVVSPVFSEDIYVREMKINGQISLQRAT